MDKERELNQPSEHSEENKIKFHYLKSHYFRVVHVDGALGGITPSGDIFFSLYNQRMPIPTLTVQPFADSALGPELMSERVIREGIVREVEVGVILTPLVASQLRDWLDEKISLIGQVEEARNKGQEDKK
jgi:hypothetical protein